MHYILKKSDPMYYAGLIIAFLTGFSINLSTSFQNIMVAILIASSIFSPHLRTALRDAFNNNFIKGALLFYLLFIIAVLWSDSPSKDILTMLLRMSLYILCPLIYVFFYDRCNTVAFFIGFAACVILAVGLIIISTISGWGFFHPAIGIHGEYMGIKIDLFRGHSYQNYFAGLVSTGILILLIEGYFKSRKEWLTAIVMLAIIFVTVFFFVTGRTGHILYIIMCGIVTLFYVKKSRMPLFSILLAAIIAITLLLSGNIKDGLIRAQQDIKNYQSGEANTSLGLRLTFYKNSLHIISQSPIYGHGTGSFRFEYERLDDKVMRTVGNPHNDYLWFGVELGVIGIAMFITFLYLSFKQILNTTMPYKIMAFVIISTYIISSINNSFFTDNLTGQFFVLSLCALLSNNENRTLQNK